MGPTLRDAALVVLAAVAGHAAALHGTGYTWDDHHAIEGSERLQVRSVAEAADLLRAPLLEHLPAERLWRPATLASFALDATLWRQHPDVHHRSSVAWHALASALLLATLRALLSRARRATLFAALAFALHPIHAEATAGLVARAEVLSLAAVLGATLLHLRAADRGAGLAGHLPAAACLFVGFGAKEVALTGPVLVALVDVARGRRLRLAPYALYAAALVLHLAARVAVTGGLAPAAGAQATGALPFGTRLLVAGEVSRDAAWSLVAPPLTSAWYPFEPPAWSQPSAVLTAAVNVLVVVLAARGLLAARPRLRALAAGALGFYVALGPVSSLVPIGIVRAERVLYVPSAYAALAFAAALALGLRRARPLVWAVVVGLTLTPLALRLEQNARAWVDDELLCRSMARRFPRESFPLYALGRRLVAGSPREALPLLQQALARIRPGDRHLSPLHQAHGEALRAEGRPYEALAALRSAEVTAATWVPAMTVAQVEVWLDLAAGAPDPAARAAALDEAERLLRAGLARSSDPRLVAALAAVLTERGESTPPPRR